jgi:hypothetical protein
MDETSFDGTVKGLALLILVQTNGHVNVRGVVGISDLRFEI